MTLLVAAVGESLGDIGDYTTCMKDDGIDLSGGDVEGYEALMAFLQSKVSAPGDIPRDEQSPTEEWQTFLLLEEAALEAAAACREEKYAEGMTILEPKLVEFTQDHASELAAVQADWAKMLVKATAQGFTP